jgi:hypothetical protein
MHPKHTGDGQPSFDTRTAAAEGPMPAPNAIHDGPPLGESVRVAEGVPPGLSGQAPPNLFPIRKTFAHHKPSAEGLDKITTLRQAFSKLQDIIDEVCPAGRERALAATNLEMSAMWAIKGVVLLDPASEVSPAGK